MAYVMMEALAILLATIGAFLIIMFFHKYGDKLDGAAIGLILACGWVMGVAFFFLK